MYHDLRFNINVQAPKTARWLLRLEKDEGGCCLAVGEQHYQESCMGILYYQGLLRRGGQVVG